MGRKELSVIPKESRYLVTPHDAFNYFAASYDFTLYAPQGVSTDSEVANSDMIETVNLIIDHNIKAIFTESTTNPERMEKLQEAVKPKAVRLKLLLAKVRSYSQIPWHQKARKGYLYRHVQT